MVFVDADAFIGLWVESGAHYDKARRILDYLKKQKIRMMTSWQVVDEVTTKISYFNAKKNSLKFLKWIIKSEIKIVYVNERMSKKIIKQFKNQKSKRVSLTDCANMVIAKDLRVKRFFSFDKIYKKNEFELLR